MIEAMPVRIAGWLLRRWIGGLGLKSRL